MTVTEQLDTQSLSSAVVQHASIQRGGYLIVWTANVPNSQSIIPPSGRSAGGTSGQRVLAGEPKSKLPIQPGSQKQTASESDGETARSVISDKWLGCFSRSRWTTALRNKRDGGGDHSSSRPSLHSHSFDTFCSPVTLCVSARVCVCVAQHITYTHVTQTQTLGFGFLLHSQKLSLRIH